MQRDGRLRIRPLAKSDQAVYTCTKSNTTIKEITLEVAGQSHVNYLQSESVGRAYLVLSKFVSLYDDFNMSPLQWVV